MIQRIQTIYLLLIAAAMAAVLFLPLATVQAGGVIYTYDVLGMHTTADASPVLAHPAWALGALSALVTALALVAVFLYRNRMRQMRLCIFNALLLVGFYVLFAFFLWNLSAQPGFHFSLRFALSLPLVSLILDYLAIRSIGADEMLVRSLNRLR
ncbi:MAG: DUF4293 domain-containing protein [Tannerella sp.]|jgi:hypothetical protein|nr:DUF4293 domain-containing protein [Tannerella sp.]